MAEFYYDNLARNLPDVYKKGTDSNNYKILEIERAANVDLRTHLEQIDSVLNIDNATGETLDLYGERFGQARGSATDAQYRVMIKSKIIRGLCNGSYKNVVDAICYTFGCGLEDVLITEDKTPMTVHVERVPLDKIVNAGFSSQQAEAIIKRLLPVTVTVKTLQFEGTFEFAETEGEYDEKVGFGDTVDGEMGGYLGLLGSQESMEELPI